MENSEALVLFSELSRATVESRLKVLVQLLLTKYGPTHGLWKWGRDRRASDRHIVSFLDLLREWRLRYELFDLVPGVGERVGEATALQLRVFDVERHVGAAKVRNLPSMSGATHHLGGTVGA